MASSVFPPRVRIFLRTPMIQTKNSKLAWFKKGVFTKTFGEWCRKRFPSLNVAAALVLLMQNSSSVPPHIAVMAFRGFAILVLERS